MWIVPLVLTLAALYAVVVMGIYFAQTWLLFPTMLARGSRVQLPASTQRLEVRTPDGERLTGVQIPSQGAAADGAPTLLGFGGNAWKPKLRPIPCMRSFLIAMSSCSTTAAMRRARAGRARMGCSQTRS